MPWIEDNLRDTNTNREEDKIVSEFTSSCSLYPQILPTGLFCEGLLVTILLSTLLCPDAGLCNSYLSEDTIPQTCLTTSIDNKYRDDRNISERHWLYLMWLLLLSLWLYLTVSLATRIWTWMRRPCLWQMTTLIWWSWMREILPG